MRVLFIGGTKFIGPPAVRRLAEAGHDVAVFHRGQTECDLPAAVRHIRGDRHSLAEHSREFGEFAPEVVVDTIAFTEQDARGLVDAFRGVANRLMILSSGDVYRAFGVYLGIEPPPIEPMPLVEDAPLRESLFIARGRDDPPPEMKDYEKILVEKAVQSDPALPATILRLPMVYGPGDEQHRLYPYLKRMDDGRKGIVLDLGLARWKCPRGYVEDVAMAIALAVEDERAAGKIYNVSDAQPHTESDWVAAIGRVIGWKGRLVIAPRVSNPVHDNTYQDAYYDTTRIRRELGYRETVTLDEGLRATIAWERAHPRKGPTIDYGLEDRILAEHGVS